MKTQDFLNELLKSGKALASKGRDIAEDKLNLPDEGNEREVALDGMKKGALAAGVLAVMLGTKAGRRVTGSVVKLGSLAAVGGIAYKAYQNWSQNNQNNQQEITQFNTDFLSVDKMDNHAAEERSVVLLKAMIAAAKADGHVNQKEMELIRQQIGRLDLQADLSRILEDELEKELDVNEVAAMAENAEMAAEIYLVSAVVSDRENSMEKDYLESLAKALELPGVLIAELENIKEAES